MTEPTQEQLNLFKAKLATTSFKIWKEEAPLVGGMYTVMHIESVFDILMLTQEFANMFGEGNTSQFVYGLAVDIMKGAGMEMEDKENG